MQRSTKKQKQQQPQPHNSLSIDWGKQQWFREWQNKQATERIFVRCPECVQKRREYKTSEENARNGETTAVCVLANNTKYTKQRGERDGHTLQWKGNVIQINRLYSFAIVFFWPLGNGLSMHWSERTNMIRLIFKSTAQSSTSNCSSLIHTKYIFLSYNEQAECYFASAEWYIETKIMMIFPNFAQIKVTHWKLDTNSNYCWSICLGLDFHLVLFANALRMCEINNVLWFSFIDSFVSYGFCGNNRYLFMYSQFRLNKANAIHLIHIGDRTFIVCGSNFLFKT